MPTHPPRNELGSQTDITADGVSVFNLREGWEFGEQASLINTESRNGICPLVGLLLDLVGTTRH